MAGARLLETHISEWTKARSGELALAVDEIGFFAATRRPSILIVMQAYNGVSAAVLLQ